MASVTTGRSNPSLEDLWSQATTEPPGFQDQDDSTPSRFDGSSCRSCTSQLEYGAPAKLHAAGRAATTASNPEACRGRQAPSETATGRIASPADATRHRSHPRIDYTPTPPHAPPSDSNCGCSPSSAITDDASPFALRSTRNRPRTAMRRGAARPRRSDQAAAGETLSRAGRRPPLLAEPAWAVERRRRRPQEHGRASQRAVARRGGQEVGCRPRLRHPVASSASVRCSVSGVRCERPVSTLACPRDRCPVSGAGV